MADIKAEVIDLNAYRAGKRVAATHAPGAGYATPDVHPVAFYCFFPVLVWMPFPLSGPSFGQREVS